VVLIRNTSIETEFREDDEQIGVEFRVVLFLFHRIS